MKLRSTALAGLSLLVLALPAAAQDPSSSSVLFDGMGFTFDQTLGESVNITRVPGQPPAPAELSAPDSPHLTFSLYGPKAEFAKMPRVGASGTVVSFFPIADLAPYPDASEELAKLQQILADRPDPAGLSEGTERLPYMPPVIDAAQIIRARAAYVDLPGLSGITYITAFGQDVYPFTSDRFEVVFQGLSTDGAWYVSVHVSLETDLFPRKVTQKDVNRITASQKAYDAYEAKSRATLESAAPDAFSPSLDTVDALVASIVLDGVPVSEGGSAAAPATGSSAAPSASPAA